ncbi:MAG: hypothetical protein V2B20_24190 [Pseudomonadota bacterium]
MDSLIWPSVVVIIGLAAILILRPAFIRLIDRTSKASKNGITFDRPQEGVNPQTPLPSFDDLMKLPVTASVLDREKYIKTNLQTFKLKDDTEKIEVLVRSFAISRLELEFNNIASSIFGSQISLLNKLSGTTQGIPVTQAEIIFNQAKDKYPATYENRTLNDWLNYLLAHPLITITNEKIDITQYGTDFLEHLVDTRQVYERHG